MSSNHQFNLKTISVLGVLVSLGIVFGDIGTSPLYVMKAIVLAGGKGINEEFLEGALSCIIWTLTLQTTIKYVIISLRADNKGEGGILALFSLVKRQRKSWLYIAAIVGASALIADGVITPSLTVMSAIEGLKIYNPHTPVVLITCVILVLIFFMQQFGTNFIGKFFGPIMVIWFLVLGSVGLYHIFDYPLIFRAFNPYYAVKLIINSPSAIIILGAVFLCTTGAEALYSDLGHCGAKNIRVSWIFVKICLLLNYLGQGAWLMDNFEMVLQKGVNPFFGIMPEWFILPGVILSTAAAIIASQALITGSFTLFSEAMSLNFWPFQSIDYPSGSKGQMYISKVNWGLLILCIVVVLFFQESGKMESAYGLSITITMLMTSLLMVFWLNKVRVNKIYIALFALVYFSIEFGFFSANIIKFYEGGWITVVLAGFIGVCMYTWYNGRKIKTKFVKFVKLDNYIPIIKDMKLDETIPKYAVNLAYFSRSKNSEEIESKIIYSMIHSQPKRADHYFILSIINHEDPYTYEYSINEILPGTIYKIDFVLGYKVDRLINDYFAQVLEDMQASSDLPNRSCHPSLRNHNISPDLKYVVIDNVYISEYLLSVKEQITMNIYHFVKKLGNSDFKAFGLASHNVVIESAPLLFNPMQHKKLTQTAFHKSSEN